MMTNDAPIITESPPENELENGVKDDTPIISESSREIELENGAKDDSDAYSDDVSPLVSETKTDSAILSKSETRWITRAKIVVLLVILVAAVLASTGVYLSSEESEETDFQVRVSKVGYYYCGCRDCENEITSHRLMFQSFDASFSLTISPTRSLQCRISTQIISFRLLKLRVWVLLLSASKGTTLGPSLFSITSKQQLSRLLAILVQTWLVSLP
jgi:hypothetical protein